jgi:KDO2-lipid IV(A) lauroyltransferase
MARTLPAPARSLICELGGRFVAWRTPEQREQVRRTLRRVYGPDVPSARLDRSMRQVFVSYARYWALSLRLPSLSPEELEAGHDVVGYEYLEAGLAQGRGVILALPHLGGWEWSAFWLTRIKGVAVTAVVEAIEPPELFEWFTDFRASLGMSIVPVGPDAARRVLAALKRNEVVCLLADRDISGTGIEVELFGEKTRLPAGPAALALRSRAPLLPTAVYFAPGGGVLGVVQPPLETSRLGSLRDDLARITGELARVFEQLIRAAPEQWHLLQPNWPSDPGYPVASPT